MPGKHESLKKARGFNSLLHRQFECVGHLGCKYKANEKGTFYKTCPVQPLLFYGEEG